ncbi:MAG: helix-turn-helix domain-containing protein [Lachnospiraceae bacterium]|nr:helix-turn-helix domain-containing protein [Lachnospiraceae bacterium]
MRQMFKALIVDDEKPARIAISKLGKWAQYRIEPPLMAANGKEALAAMREVRPEIVFVDMNMPIMSGTEFLRLASAEFPDTCFIVISGYDEFAYAQQALRCGALDYLLKPIVEEHLNSAILRAVQTLCPGYQPDSQNQEETNLDPNTVVSIIHDYIEKNYSKNIKISMFADKYFFSKEYLTRQFKGKYHCGIYEYVLQVRMARAKELLTDPALKIQDVAQRVGYTDHNYFSKAFRTYFGISPSAFRQERGIE